MSNIRCPDCSKLLSVSDINMEKMLARCRDCETVFDATSQLEDGAWSSKKTVGPSGVAEKAIRPKIPQPKSVKVKRRGSEFTLSRSWWAPQHWFIVFFCIAWDSFLFYFYYEAYNNFLETGWDGFDWFSVIFPIAHLAVGVWLTYALLATVFNTTNLILGSRDFTLSHGPLPWAGNLSLPKRELSQLFVVEKRGGEGGSTFGLYALLKDETRVHLLSQNISLDEARFIEQTLEEHLGIEDVPVEGEAPLC